MMMMMTVRDDDEMYIIYVNDLVCIYVNEYTIIRSG